MIGRGRPFPIAIVLAALASPAARAAPNLTVRSDGECPSTGAVRSALLAIRPDDEWPPVSADIQTDGDSIAITLGDDATRGITVPADCAARARAVALVIATWSGELPEQAAAAPSLSAAAPAPLLTRRAARVFSLGISVFYSMVGGSAPGALVELGNFGRAGGFGFRVHGAYQAAKSVALDMGESNYYRSMLAAAVAYRWSAPRLFLAADVGIAGNLTRAWGSGYSQDQSDYALNAGLFADGRIGLRWGRFALWSDFRMYRWPRAETLHVDTLSTGPYRTTILPAWDAHWGLGAGWVFE